MAQATARKTNRPHHAPSQRQGEKKLPGNAATKKAQAQQAEEAQETKREKFIRLANKRVNSALKYIRLIGNLSGPGYEKTDDDVKKIVNAIEGAAKDVAARLTHAKAERPSFALGEEAAE